MLLRVTQSSFAAMQNPENAHEWWVVASDPLRTGHVLIVTRYVGSRAAGAAELRARRLSKIFHALAGFMPRCVLSYNLDIDKL